MIIRKSKSWLWVLLLVSCSRDLSDDPVPYIPFNDIVINLNLPEYITLRSDGGYKEINGGVRGIILYRKSASVYLAYERNCTYRPNEACATVNVHNSGLFMTDPCCNSDFSFADGSPTNGVAWRALIRYRTQVDGLTLTVSSEVVN
jgi:hypothetical protein